jgi:dipeptidase
MLLVCIRRLILVCAFLAALLPGLVPQSQACTSYLITKGASADGSTMITYAADSHELYGELYYTPAARHAAGTMLKIHEWDTGKYLGEIPQAAETYTVVGNMNQFQVAIGETTWGGREELFDPKGIIDYGSLIYIALQRSKTAREAIQVMTTLVAEHGYASTGESFSIADPNEVWLMEMIGKGADNKGAVWVARKVPDGYICAHANAARIRQFPWNDPGETWYSKDVASFAREKGYFQGKDAEFSFADAYAPAEFGSRRFCDGRVWCMFTRSAPGMNLSSDWVKGSAGAQPLPLWIRPEKKLSVQDVMLRMRDHFEGTEFDMTRDIGAGPYDLPYRWRPLTWKIGESEYLNERAVSTQQTGFSFVSQSRSQLPDEIGGLLWFGVDDTSSTVYFPMYSAASKVPVSFAVGTGSFHKFDPNAAFWVFNQVSNFAYIRYRDMIKDIQQVQGELEGRFLAQQPQVEQAALALYKQSPRLAVDYLTNYSVACGDDVVQRWRKLSEQLLYKYLDGNVKDAHGHVTHPGYPESWYEKVAAASGEDLKVQKLVEEATREELEKEKTTTRCVALRAAILNLLKSRTMAISADQEAHIQGCEKPEQLEKALLAAATAATTAEVLTEIKVEE